MAKEIGINITAKDDASKVIDKVAKSLDKTGDAAKSAAEQIADGLGNAVDQLEVELKGTKKAADALSKAMGPDLAAKVHPEELVTKFRALGAEFDDIEANADKLAASVKRLDDLDASMGHLGGTTRKTGDELDRSRGVMANFVGNAAQDLPGISGSFGALNVAAGQFAEYATEGGISLKGLAATAGPIAGITVGMELLSRYMDNIAKSKAFAKEQVDGFAKGLKDGLTAVEAIKTRLEELGKVEIWSESSPLSGGAKDITDSLAAVGLQAGELARIAAGGKAEVDKYLSKINALWRAGAISRETWMNVTAAVTNAGHAAREAMGEQARYTAVFGASTEVVVANMDAYLQMANAGVIATDQLGEAAISTGTATEDLGYLFGTTAVKAGELADETGIAARKLADLETAWASLNDTLSGRAEQRAIDAAQAQLDSLIKAGGRRPSKKQQAAISAASDDVIGKRLAQAEGSGNAFLGQRVLEVLIKPKVDEGSAADVARRLDMLAQLRIIPFEATLNTTRLGPLSVDGGLDPTAVAEALKRAKRDGLLPPGTTP